MAVAINLCAKIGVLRQKFTPNLFDMRWKNGVLANLFDKNFTLNLFDLRGVLRQKFTPNLFNMVNLWRSRLK